jgi:hypothetical protein
LNVVDGLAPFRDQYGVGFGDGARIRSTPETEEAGFAGMVGYVLGETIPSQGPIEGAPIIGKTNVDFALYVDFDEHGGAWFDPEVVERAPEVPPAEFEIGT